MVRPQHTAPHLLSHIPKVYYSSIYSYSQNTVYHIIYFCKVKIRMFPVVPEEYLYDLLTSLKQIKLKFEKLKFSQFLKIAFAFDPVTHLHFCCIYQELQNIQKWDSLCITQL